MSKQARTRRKRVPSGSRRILTIVKEKLANVLQVGGPSTNVKDRLMNRLNIALSTATVSVTVIAPWNVAAAVLQAQPKVQVVAPAGPNAPPVTVVEPPDPNAPRVAVVPPPGGEVRIVIPVAADSVAALPDCSSKATTHCVLNRKKANR